MARIAYLDCAGGISGDMLLGSFVSAGVDPAKLAAELDKLNLPGWRLSFRDVDKAGVMALKADVAIDAPDSERTLKNINGVIRRSGLSGQVKTAALRVFKILADAEAAAHGLDPDIVHFHEVGAVDAIIDICGTAQCLAYLGIERLYVTDLEVSRPAPATLAILKSCRFKMVESGIENVTPTGAAVLKALAEWSAPPEMTLTGLGCGAGNADTEKANVLRLLVGEAVAEVPGQDVMTLLETNIDDVTAEQLSYVLDTLLAAGAADVWFTPVIMKKGRPAHTLSCLAPPGLTGELAEIIFRETGTLGIRMRTTPREVLARNTVVVTTEFGEIRVKIGVLGGAVVSVRPEYEDCAKAARNHGRPIKEVYKTVLKMSPRS